MPRPTTAAMLLGLALLFGGPGPSSAQEMKLPLESDDRGSLYVAPKIAPTETAATANGATVGVQRPDGSSAYGGMDTSSSRPTYSVGGSTGGDVSFSAGASSDGKKNNGVKAGITIKY